MKKALAVGVCCLVITASVTAQKKSEKGKPELKSEKDRVGYLIGYDVGSKLNGDLKQRSIEISNDALLRGIKDALAGAKMDLPDSIVQSTMMAFQQKLAAKQSEDMKKMYDKNKKEGDTFLASNAKKDSIKVTASGLQYKILREGTGKTPVDTSTVTVHYRGTLIDGTVFDESYKRGEPTTFPVNGVIKGWTEALKLMKVGAKYQLFIPTDLAYGERGAGQSIAPGAALIFEVELINVK